MQDSTEPAWVRTGLDRCLEKAQQKQRFSPRESLTAGSSAAGCRCRRNPPALALALTAPNDRVGFAYLLLRSPLAGLVPCSSHMGESRRGRLRK